MNNRRHIVVYVAGRFRAPDSWEIEQNIRKAEALSLEVWKAGFTAFCPHKNTQHFQGALPDDVWLSGDLAILSNCDAVLTVPGWEESEGASEEVRFAKFRRIPVFHSLEELKENYNV